MRLSELGVDEILAIVNDPDSDPQLKAKAIRFLKRMMNLEEEGDDNR